jgi:hypothetical protein
MEENRKNSIGVLRGIEELLIILEREIVSKKRTKVDFNKLLKKKFVEKADKYSFLDPFAAEFEYNNGRLIFKGDASDEDLAVGVVESVRELANELNIAGRLRKQLEAWSLKYEEMLIEYDIII